MFLIRYIMYRLKKTKRIMKDEMKKKGTEFQEKDLQNFYDAEL